MSIVLNKIVNRYRANIGETNEIETTKLYLKIYDLLRNMIVNNDIPQQTQLPASRLLAAELGVSRSTILKSYEFLKLEGYIEAKPGSGIVVKRIKHDNEPFVHSPEMKYPEISSLGKSFMENGDLINSTSDKSVAFRPGLPPLDIFPVNQWKNLSNFYWKNITLSNLSYSPSSGIEQLKHNLANYLNLSRDLKCSPDQIMIVSGSLQSLYLIGSSTLNPGDGVQVENPTFPNVLSIFKGLKANIKGVSIDQEGMMVSELTKMKEAVKLIHVTPSCHYPLGAKMSLERRKKVLEYANEKGAIIIENDYEHELNNWKQKLPTIYSLDKEERTIYLGTFNRLLHPSLRIGYMVVPHYLRNVMEALLNHSHRFVPTSIQVVLNQFIEKKYIYEHVKNVVTAVQKRKSIFTEYFNKLFEKHGLELSQNAMLSLQSVVPLPNHVADKELVKAFREREIIVHSLSKCFVQQSAQQGLILGHSSVKSPVIKNKLNQMQSIYEKWQG